MSGRSENDAFSRCHPLVSFLFFAGAIVMGAMITHPVCVLAEFCGALLYTILLALLALLAVLILHMVFSGATDAAFTPRIEIPALRGRYLPGFLAFCIFLSLPSMLYIKEAIQWRISRSGI